MTKELKTYGLFCYNKSSIIIWCLVLMWNDSRWRCVMGQASESRREGPGPVLPIMEEAVCVHWHIQNGRSKWGRVGTRGTNLGGMPVWITVNMSLLSVIEETTCSYDRGGNNKGLRKIERSPQVIFLLFLVVFVLFWWGGSEFGMRIIIISNLIRRVICMKNDVSHLGRMEVQQGCGLEV